MSWALNRMEIQSRGESISGAGRSVRKEKQKQVDSSRVIFISFMSLHRVIRVLVED